MKKNLLFLVNGLICLFITINVSEAQSLKSFQQSSGTDNLVVMEAENFHENIPGAPVEFPAASGTFITPTWTIVADSLGFAGTGAMQALPNAGISHGDVAVAKGSSPRLNFRVNFVRTGVHYIWIRANVNNSGGDRSVHAGLNDSIWAPRMEMMTLRGWKWRSKISGATAPPPTINIKTKGEHTISLWMRQDGFQIDRILLTTNKDYEYSLPVDDIGPAESPRSGTTGITRINDNNYYSMSIYPNPSYGNTHLNFDSNKVEDVDITILNLVGQKLISKNYKSISLINGIDLPTQSLESGIYLIQCKIAGHTQSAKFIKN
jgi:hypothetical protein